ncbi:hypothetical protein, partial [Microbacterium sp.]|uniref:hypothetical protein n=1 Tax=Microbacterium sp. TaxID=51671 RepID=UPI003A949DF6
MLTGILPAVLAIGIVMGAGVPSDLPDDGGISDLVQASTDEDGHQVVVKGRSTQGASRSRGSDGTLPKTKAGSQPGGDSIGVVPHPNPDALPAVPGEIVPVDCTAADVACRGNSPAGTPAAAGRVIPAVTVSDLVSFRPVVPGLSSE